MMPSASFSYQVLGKLALAVSIRPQNAACLRLKKNRRHIPISMQNRKKRCLNLENGIAGDIFVYRLLVAKKRNT